MFSSGTFTVEGAGADIWGTADAFRYVWQPINGDVDIIARVIAVDNVDAWTKAGVMIREQLTATSPHAFMLVSAAKGLAFQRRVSAGGLSTHTAAIASTAPAWVGLQRRGNTITGYYSLDGSNWTRVGSETYLMSAAVYVGLAVTSHNSSQLAVAVFDDVRVRSGLPEPWEAQDIGTVGLAGTSSEASGTFTVRGAGADIWGTADAFQFVWQRLSGDGVVTARVSEVEPVAPWVKAGVMIRERLTADSAHAFMLVSAEKGLAFQRRLATALLSSHTGTAGAAPMWVKLERGGDVISAYASADGVAWTLVGSETFTMGSDVYIGLAVTSHDATRLATATFDNVSVR